MAIDLRGVQTPTGWVRYGTTNPWFAHALDWWTVAFRGAVSAEDRRRLTTDWDVLFPDELEEMGFEPARAVMRLWKDCFFAEQEARTLDALDGDRPRTEFGLVRTGASGPIPEFAVAETANTHNLKMLSRMRDFLRWFGPDPDLLRRCVGWAEAVMLPAKRGNGEPPYGHFVGRTWRVYDHVVVGGAGTPHGLATRTNMHGILAQAFEELSRSLMIRDLIAVVAAGMSGGQPGDDGYDARRYARFAERVNWEMWRARLNTSTHLMPDTVTAFGPLPGDRGADDARQYSGHSHDTDSLYWARSLFAVYLAHARTRRPDLIPPRLGAADVSPIELRRMWLSVLESSFFAPILGRGQEPGPGLDRYLWMAIRATLDWIRGAWFVDRSAAGRDHFVRKIFLDGGRPSDSIYGDGMWNTLYVLVDAYRVTGDELYLEYLRTALETFRATSLEVETWWVRRGGAAVEEDVRHERVGLFHPLTAGALDNRLPLVRQELFVDVMTSAYEATREWGAPREELLTWADELAGHVVDRLPLAGLARSVAAGADVERDVARQNARVLFAFNNGFAGTALLRLARARRPLHRVAFRTPRDVTALGFVCPSMPGAPVWIDGLEGAAIVYMDENVADESYQVRAMRSDGAVSEAQTIRVTGPVREEAPIEIAVTGRR